MGTVTKKPWESKTYWFALILGAFGVFAIVLNQLGQQGVISTESGVGFIITSIVNVILRNRTSVAIALGVDDPTTPEDESKGERAAKDTGFILVRLLVLIAALSFITISLTGCAHLTPKEQEAVNASMTCATDILTAAQTCVPECIGLTEDTGLKSCAVACVVSVLETAGPECGKVYGDIYSPELGTAISATVVSVMSIYEAVDK